VSLLTVMLGAGTGAELMRRIAAPMVGGMVSAMVLTLLIIPAAFLIWKGIRIRRGLKMSSATAEVPIA